MPDPSVPSSAAASHSAPPACPGTLAGTRYHLEELLAESDRSWIYRATDLLLAGPDHPPPKPQVAVKIFKSPAEEAPASFLPRRIDHPNIARVLDRGRSAEGWAFSVSEFASGGDLRALQTPMPIRDACTLVAALARGVQAAHRSGVLHCDIKPANVLLAADGSPKLADFEFAVLSASEPASLAPRRGSPAFMAPEQLDAEAPIGPPADVYALGGVLYFLLAGRVPNRAEGGDAVAVLRGLSPRASLDAPEPLRAIVLRALSLNPAERHHAPAELAADLERFLAHQPIDWTNPSVFRRARLWSRRHPIRTTALCSALVLVLASAAAALFWQASERSRHEWALAESRRLADLELEAVRSKAQVQIENVAGAVVTISSGDQRLFTAIVFLDFLGKNMALTADGKLPAATQRVQALSTLLAIDHQFGRDHDLINTITRFARAQTLFAADRHGEAIADLDELNQVWSARLPETDRWLLECRAMHRLATLFTQPEPFDPAVRKELLAIESQGQELAFSPPTMKLVRRCLQRLKTAQAR
jgi:Protein kinase domain